MSQLDNMLCMLLQILLPTTGTDMDTGVFILSNNLLVQKFPTSELQTGTRLKDLS